MPTELQLINYEKFASLVFIYSGFLSLFSSFEAEKYELEKQTEASGSNESTMMADKLALDSTFTEIFSFSIFLIVAIFRTNALEQKIASGESKISILPNIILVSSFIIGTMSGIIRVPAIQQRLVSGQTPVIL